MNAPSHDPASPYFRRIRAGLGLAAMIGVAACAAAPAKTDAPPNAAPVENPDDVDFRMPTSPGVPPGSPTGAGDTFTPAVEIGPGTKPAIAVDAQRRAVHLVYRRDHGLYYRRGDLDGRFGAEERILEMDFTGLDPGKPDDKLELEGTPWDPRVAVDRNGDPHMVATSGNFLNRKGWYTNRIGGAWKPALEFLDKHTHAVSRVTMASLAIDDDLTVFITAYAPAGILESQDADVKSMLVKVTDVATTPKVARMRRDFASHPQIALAGGVLWHGGMLKGYCLKRHDKKTLAPTGRPICLTDGRGNGENARLHVDAAGDIHMAGSYVGTKGRPGPGWYSSLARARIGQGALHYHTTNRHAWGAGMPVRDLVAKDRVYVVHWSGAEGNQHGELRLPGFGDVTGNQLRVARFDDGALAAQHQAVTDRPATHGYPRRATPAAAAHPEGGLAIVFQEVTPGMRREADEAGTLFFTRIIPPATR